MPPIIDDGEGTDWADLLKFPPWREVAPDTFNNGIGQFTETNPVPARDGGRGFSAPSTMPADSSSSSHKSACSGKGQ